MRQALRRRPGLAVQGALGNGHVGRSSVGLQGYSKSPNGMVRRPVRQGDRHSGTRPDPTSPGIGKAGNRRVRTVMVELAWLWTRYQPGAAQICWFRERVGSTGRRVRKIMVVALARKLLIALWAERSLDRQPRPTAQGLSHPPKRCYDLSSVLAGATVTSPQEHISADRRKTTPSNGDRTQEGIPCRRELD